MGRRAIPIELIDEARKRHTTFNKRKSGLLKKAAELSILCDVEISVIMFSKHNGETKMHQYTSSDPQAMLERALTFPGPVENFTNASFSHASSLSEAPKRGEKRSRDDAFATNPVALMTQLLNSTPDDFEDTGASPSARKVSKLQIYSVPQAYTHSLEGHLQHTASQIEDTDSQTFSNVNSNDYRVPNHIEQTAVATNVPWESTKGNDSNSYSNENSIVSPVIYNYLQHTVSQKEKSDSHALSNVNSNDYRVPDQEEQNGGVENGPWESTDGNDSHSYSNEDSNVSPIIVQGHRDGCSGSEAWEATGGDESMVPTSMPTSSVAPTSCSMTLKPSEELHSQPSPVQRGDHFGQNTQPWRRSLNVHIPYSNTHTASELSARMFRTPKNEDDQQTLSNSFENPQAITDVPLDPLVTPKAPFGFPSPAIINAARLVTSEALAYPTAQNFPAS